MKVIYISGPYRAATISGIRRNIEKAREVAERVWQMGLYALCPHLNTAFMDGLCPDDVWLRGDLVMLERCDGILMVGNWESSKGARAELEKAGELALPAFFSMEELEAWKDSLKV